MTTWVVDASIAIKWVVEEEGTSEALALRNGASLLAPELLVAECADILWKKVQRNELLAAEADLAARLLQLADVDLMPMRGLMREATRLSIALSHPAYDCIYLALAKAEGARFVTADGHFLRKILARADLNLSTSVISLFQTQ